MKFDKRKMKQLVMDSMRQMHICTSYVPFRSIQCKFAAVRQTSSAVGAGDATIWKGNYCTELLQGLCFIVCVACYATSTNLRAMLVNIG